MLYTLSSFIDWLKKQDCEIEPLKGKNVVRIRNGVMRHHIWVDKKNRINYEEIYIAYNRLLLTDLPGDKDLEMVE